MPASGVSELWFRFETSGSSPEYPVTTNRLSTDTNRCALRAFRVSAGGSGPQPVGGAAAGAARCCRRAGKHLMPRCIDTQEHRPIKRAERLSRDQALRPLIGLSLPADNSGPQEAERTQRNDFVPLRGEREPSAPGETRPRRDQCVERQLDAMVAQLANVLEGRGAIGRLLRPDQLEQVRGVLHVKLGRAGKAIAPEAEVEPHVVLVRLLPLEILIPV